MWTTFDSLLTRGKSDIIAATITNHGEIQLKHYSCLYQTVDNSWWRHQMEPFSALLAICAGNSPVIGEFPAQRPVTRSFDAFFDLRLNKRLSKQSFGARDLRRYRAHFDVTVMSHSTAKQRQSDIEITRMFSPMQNKPSIR